MERRAAGGFKSLVTLRATEPNWEVAEVPALGRADSQPITYFMSKEVVGVAPTTTRRYAGSTTLSFSPDGRSIAFTSNRDGARAVWSIPSGGGAVVPLLAIKGANVASISWASNGDLFVAADRGGTERWQPYVRRADGTVMPFATSPDDSVQHFLSRQAVSPDGRWIAFASNGREPSDVDVLIADTDGGTQRRLVSGPAWHRDGGWSPDGRRLLVTRVRDNADQDLLLVDVATGAMHELTPPRDGKEQNVPVGWLADGRALGITDAGSEHLWLAAYDPQTGVRTAIDRPEWDIEVAASTPDGTVQAWAVNVDGYSTLRWRTGDGRGGEHELGGVVGDIAISADGSQLAFFRYSAASLPELRVLRTSDSHVRTVYRVESEADLSLAEPELVRVPASDGPIPVFVFMPKVHAAAVPAVLVIHGGPEAQSRPVPGTPLLRALLARGIAIVMPNIHGSTGYGKSWQTSIHHDWGGIDLRDLGAMAEWMATHPGFRHDRLAVFGGSYGGWASLLCITRLPRYWRCAVDWFGWSDLVQALELAAPNWRRFMERWIGNLETDREKLVARSPITHIENVRCPILVAQGANDPRVPKAASDVMVERLRGLGQQVEYLLYEGEGHGFSKRENQIDAQQRTLDFLSGHLLS